MGSIGYGYGSECHLLRYMGRHRRMLDDRLLGEIRSSGAIEWQDFGFDEGQPWPDSEPKGLDFLQDAFPDVVNSWKKEWPQTGSPPNWDAIAWHVTPDGKSRECLLIEAKANLQEIRNPKGCGAKAGSHGRSQIEEFFNKAKGTLGITDCGDWMGAYYQYANRVALLEFLNRHGVPSRLVYIYFIGDRGFAGRQCPASKEEWMPAINAQEQEVLGSKPPADLCPRIHKVFLNVLGG